MSAQAYEQRAQALQLGASRMIAARDSVQRCRVWLDAAMTESWAARAGDQYREALRSYQQDLNSLARRLESVADLARRASAVAHTQARLAASLAIRKVGP